MEYQAFKKEAQEALLKYVSSENFYYKDDFLEKYFFVEHIKNTEYIKNYTDSIEIQNPDTDFRYSVCLTPFGISEVEDTSC